MSIFGYLKRKLKKAIKRGVEPSEAKDIYEEEHTKQEKEMHEEVRSKKRSKGRYTGRRTEESKTISRHPIAVYDPKLDVELKHSLENISLSSAKTLVKTKLGAIRVEEEYKEAKEILNTKHVS